MDIVLLIGAIAAALLLKLPRALVVTGLVWAFCVAMVAVGPAHNDTIHVASAGFWIPWAVAGVIAVLVVLGISALRSRRAGRRAPA
jgi:Na+-transporting NADH:ubiquinone oxidoreductase subunit NqrB